MAGRRTFADVDAEARSDERMGMMLHAREHVARVRASLAAGKIDAATATLTMQHVNAFASECSTGLHVGGHDSRATRRMTRAKLSEAGLLGSGGK